MAMRHHVVVPLTVTSAASSDLPNERGERNGKRRRDEAVFRNGKCVGRIENTRELIGRLIRLEYQMENPKISSKLSRDIICRSRRQDSTEELKSKRRRTELIDLQAERKKEEEDGIYSCPTHDSFEFCEIRCTSPPADESNRTFFFVLPKNFHLG